MEAGILCSIDGKIFYWFTKNTWISYSGTLNNDTGLYNLSKISKFVQGSADNMSAIKKGNLHMKVCQVDGSGAIFQR